MSIEVYSKKGKLRTTPTIVELTEKPKSDLLKYIKNLKKVDESTQNMVESVKEVKDIVKAVSKNDTEEVIDTLNVLKLVVEKYEKTDTSGVSKILKDKIEDSINIVSDIESEIKKISPIVNEMKKDFNQTIERKIVNISDADEVNIIKAKKISKPRSNAWQEFVKQQRAKPKYAKMNYKEFIKIASAKYKKLKSN